MHNSDTGTKEIKEDNGGGGHIWKIMMHKKTERLKENVWHKGREA